MVKDRWAHNRVICNLEMVSVTQFLSLRRSHIVDKNPRLLGKPYVLPRSISECRAFGADYSLCNIKRSVEAASSILCNSSMVIWAIVTDFMCEPLLRQQRFFDGVGFHGNRVRSIGCGRGILDERLDDSIGV